MPALGRCKDGPVTISLTGKQRRHLRALAHDRKPVVQIGHAGLTKPVIEAIDGALETHELVKIKVSSEAPDAADALAPRLEKATRSTVAQVIGHTLVLYRRREDNPQIVLPKAKKRSKRSEG
jgi:RNA-binding protein